MRYFIRHQSQLRLPARAGERLELRLTPRGKEQLRVVRRVLEVAAKHRLRVYRDAEDNLVEQLSLLEHPSRVRLELELEIELGADREPTVAASPRSYLARIEAARKAGVDDPGLRRVAGYRLDSQPRLAEWWEIFEAERGWIGFDSDDGVLAAQSYVVLCVGRNATAPALVCSAGSRLPARDEVTVWCGGGAVHDLSVRSQLSQLDEEAALADGSRAEWKQLDDAGARVDRALKQAKLQLLSGGEPTFSQPFSDLPEWRGQALGDDKLERAQQVARSLAQALGGVVTKHPGRVYPGNERRWMLCVHFADGGFNAKDARRLGLGDEESPRIAPARRRGRRLIRSLGMVPDPGVLEINLPPCNAYMDAKRLLLAVYKATSKAGLAGYRVLHNGRLVDSGGGGHLTLGGPTPEDSPFRRRPDLVSGFVAYTHNHPCLSYLFTGLFAGGTSQAARPDETGVDAHAALERAINALRHEQPDLPGTAATLAPLLVDATGNAHRAGINIEKLCAPYPEDTGNLGLLDLRAFSSQPSAFCQLGLMLLARAIVARLALEPYLAPLFDWGSSLHDDFSRPSVLVADLESVLDDLTQHGLGLPVAPFAHSIAWRYPALLALRARDTRLTVRQALPIWPVLGSLGAQEGAPSRFTDSSSDRLELELEGAGSLEVNGAAARLPDGGGLMTYRAAPPIQGGHEPLKAPEIPVKFKLIPARGRSVARIYQPWHPTGGQWEGLPRSLSEARRRRKLRVKGA